MVQYSESGVSFIGRGRYYGLVKAGSQSLGMKGVLKDMGQDVAIDVRSDASAAIGIAKRRGVGKVRHIEVSQLWLQDRVARGALRITKCDGKANVADGLTKYIAGDPQWHMSKVNQFVCEGRHSSAPQVNADKWEGGDNTAATDDECEDDVGEDDACGVDSHVLQTGKVDGVRMCKEYGAMPKPTETCPLFSLELIRLYCCDAGGVD